MFDSVCVIIYVQGLYDQTFAKQENDANVKKYDKSGDINVNEYLILVMHHQFVMVTILMDYVDKNQELFKPNFNKVERIHDNMMIQQYFNMMQNDNKNRNCHHTERHLKNTS